MIRTIDARMIAKMFLGGAKNLESKKEWIDHMGGGVSREKRTVDYSKEKIL